MQTDVNAAASRPVFARGGRHRPKNARRSPRDLRRNALAEIRKQLKLPTAGAQVLLRRPKPAAKLFQWNNPAQKPDGRASLFPVHGEPDRALMTVSTATRRRAPPARDPDSANASSFAPSRGTVRTIDERPRRATRRADLHVAVPPGATARQGAAAASAEKPAIIGLLGFANLVRTIWHGARADDPYADWWLLQVHEAMVQTDA